MRIRTAIVASLLTAACASGGGDEGIVDFEASIQPNPGYDVRGSARAIASIGATAVTVNVENGTPRAIYPWHVHQGRCGSGGGIVGSASDYPPIEVDADGEERAVATIGVQLDDDIDYYVNIHLSPQQMGVIVACGELVD